MSMDRLTKEAAVMAKLAGGRWVPHLELRRVGGTRFSGRLFDLKCAGLLRYERKWVNGQWSYRRV